MSCKHLLHLYSETYHFFLLPVSFISVCLFCVFVSVHVQEAILKKCLVWIDVYTWKWSTRKLIALLMHWQPSSPIRKEWKNAWLLLCVYGVGWGTENFEKTFKLFDCFFPILESIFCEVKCVQVWSFVRSNLSF